MNFSNAAPSPNLNLPTDFREEPPRLEAFPLFNFKMSLIENTPKRANRNLVLLWHDHRIYDRLRMPNKLYVAALLADFCKADSLQAAFYFAESFGLKPRQLQPRSVALVGDV